jgi:hypothetical protein
MFTVFRPCYKIDATAAAPPRGARQYHGRDMTLTSQAAAGETKHAAVRPQRVFVLPLATRLLSLLGVGFSTVATGIMIAFAVLVLRMQWGLGLFMAACAGFMGALTGYVGRDLRGKWGLRVKLDADAVTLDLPAGRSLIHRPPAQHITIPYAEIEAIETRLEAYGSLGMETMQRAYVLRLGHPSKELGGELIFLFEERALATALESSLFKDIITDLAARAGVELRELGMVEGRGGLLCAWDTHAPDWAAPPLPRDRQLRLWRHAASTGSLAISVVILVILMMRFFGTG